LRSFEYGPQRYLKIKRTGIVCTNIVNKGTSGNVVPEPADEADATIECVSSSREQVLTKKSQKFKNMTGRLSFHTMVQKYGVPVVIGLVVISIIGFKVIYR